MTMIAHTPGTSGPKADVVRSRSIETSTSKAVVPRKRDGAWRRKWNSSVHPTSTITNILLRTQIAINVHGACGTRPHLQDSRPRATAHTTNLKDLNRSRAAAAIRVIVLGQHDYLWSCLGRRDALLVSWVPALRARRQGLDSAGWRGLALGRGRGRDGGGFGVAVGGALARSRV